MPDKNCEYKLPKFNLPQADPLENHAFFDGIYLETDYLTDIFRDKVLTILPEEQVFVCRQMIKSILKLRDEIFEKESRGLNVLDIGTGSGVFAIYVDKVLNIDYPKYDSNENQVKSTVTAIDKELRAIKTAKSNCKINGTSEDTVKILNPQKYKEYIFESNSFDLIITNPPFNPTWPELEEKAASFSLAGDLGVELFLEWIPYINLHLKQGGLILGCQTSPVDKDNQIVALKELSETFGSESQIKYCHVLSEPNSSYSTRDFLTQQYRDYLMFLDPENKNSLDDWIVEKSQEYPQIAYIYYEAKKIGGEGKIENSIIPIPQQEEVQKNFTWQHRIDLHKLVINCIEKPENLEDSFWESPLAKIDLGTAGEREETYKHCKLCIEKDEEFLKSITHPFTEYMSRKLMLWNNENKQGKWLSENLSCIFSENVFFSPYDYDAPWQILDYGLGIPIDIEKQDKLEQIFKKFDFVVERLYSNRASILFSPCFREANTRDQWSPKIGKQDEYLITFYSDIKEKTSNQEFVKMIDSELSQKYPSYKYQHFLFEVKDNIKTISKSYFRATSNERLWIEDKVYYEPHEDLRLTHEASHYLLHKWLEFQNETFLISLPMYIKCSLPREPIKEPYTLGGAIFILGEFKQSELLEDAKEKVWKHLKDFAIELRKDFAPIVAGYAYYRTNQKNRVQIMSINAHERAKFGRLLSVKTLPKIMEIVQDIWQIDTYDLDNPEVIPNTRIQNLLEQPFKKLVDYFLKVAVVSHIGREGKLSGLSLEEQKHKFDQLYSKIIAITKIIYSPESLGQAKIIDTSLISPALMLTTGIINNAVQKISSWRKDKITIQISSRTLRIINSHTSKQVSKSGTFDLIYTLCGRYKLERRNEIRFEEISQQEVTEKEDQEAEEWQKFYANKDNSKYKLWITQVPLLFSLE